MRDVKLISLYGFIPVTEFENIDLYIEYVKQELDYAIANESVSDQDILCLFIKNTTCPILSSIVTKELAKYPSVRLIYIDTSKGDRRFYDSYTGYQFDSLENLIKYFKDPAIVS